MAGGAVTGPADGYSTLKRYCIELAADAVVYEQGVVPPYFYLLLAGRVVFEVADGLGGRSVVGEVQPGEPFGVVAAFSGRPTSAAARTAARCTVIAVPVNAAAEAFRTAPELSIALIRQLVRRPLSSHTAAADPDAIAAEEEHVAFEELPPPATGHATPADTLAGFNEAWFFKDETACPACQQPFAYLRVRASAVRPAGRDSDFRIIYRTVDPTVHAVTVCPSCAYASYEEEFGTLTAIERRAIAAQRDARVARMPAPLCGERTIDDAALSIDLALQCAQTRNLGWRRRAGLLHRRAWVERGRGDEAAERALLEQTRAAYLMVYEQDPDIQDASALRVAYLIGDLQLRLGDPVEARRWLMECIQMKGGREQEGLLRMARLRLEDIRDGQAERLARTA